MKLLFRALRGSQAYGTATPESDRDYVGLYQQLNRELLGYGYKEQIDINKEEVHYEIKRFLELAETANPTILETMFLPKDCILIQDPILNILFENRDKFLTKKCRNSFGGYAVQQIKKARGLNKKQNWEAAKLETRKTPIEFCYVVLDTNTRIDDVKQGVYPLVDWLRKNDTLQENVYVNKLDHTKEGYQLYSGNYGGIIAQDSTRLRTHSSPSGVNPIATILYNADAYRQHCADFLSYQTWLKERNTARYSDFEKHGQQIDGKNMLHCRRLLDVAMEIATEKTINVRRPNAEYLLSIRRGEVNLEDILKQAEEDLAKMDELFLKSDLPDSVDSNLKEEILLTIRGELK